VKYSLIQIELYTNVERPAINPAGFLRFGFVFGSRNIIVGRKINGIRNTDA